MPVGTVEYQGEIPSNSLQISTVFFYSWFSLESGSPITSKGPAHKTVLAALGGA